MLCKQEYIFTYECMKYKNIINEYYSLENVKEKLLGQIPEIQEKYYINDENGTVELKYFDNCSFIDRDTFSLLKNLFGFKKNEEKNRDNDISYLVHPFEVKVFYIEYNKEENKILKLDNFDNPIERYFIKLKDRYSNNYLDKFREKINEFGLDIALSSFRISNKNQIKQSVEYYDTKIGNFYNLILITSFN